MKARNALLIEEADKSKFICLKLPDSSIYFGEVAFVNEAGEFVDPNAQVQEEESKEESEEPELDEYGDPISSKPVLKRARHGLGVQLFGTTSASYLCKYEGWWHMDQKHGEGKCTYPDKSSYWGLLKMD